MYAYVITDKKFFKRSVCTVTLSYMLLGYLCWCYGEAELRPNLDLCSLHLVIGDG